MPLSRTAQLETNSAMRNLMLTCGLAAVLVFGTLWASHGPGSSGVRQLLDVSKQPLTPGFEHCDRLPNNKALATFAANAVKKVHCFADPGPAPLLISILCAYVQSLPD